MKKTTRVWLRPMLTFLIAALAVLLLLPQAGYAAGSVTPGRVTLSGATAPAYNKIKITWKKTSNATNYAIYYRKNGTKKWTKIATVSGNKTSYTHTSSKKYPIIVGQKYNYTVKAYNKSSKKFGGYNTKGLTVRTLPATVKMKSVKVNRWNTAVTIKWNKAAGCNYYILYRRNTVTATNGSVTTTKWKKIATMRDSTTETSILNFVDSSPVHGEKNIYTVKGYYSKTKVFGGYSKNGLSAYVKADTTNIETPGTTITTESTVETESEQTKYVPLQAFSIYHSDALEIWLDQGAYTFSVTYYPSNATDKTVIWSSSDPSVATISNGTLIPRKYGTTVITAKTLNGDTEECTVTVNDIDGMIQEAIELTNKERIADGEAPLKTNENLQKAAMVRAEECATYFSHYRPDGRDSSTALMENGVAHHAGENIAAGYETAAAVINGWMNSQGHKVALLGSTHTHIGIGVYVTSDGRFYWTQEFTDGDPNDRVTLTFDTMGGSYVEPVTVPTGGYVDVRNTIPQKNGYTFEGWYLNTAFNASAVYGHGYLNRNMTLYAKWK